ncbi:MAG: High potential iron-sulfur protein [Gammaproteobacteria bacterium]|nr:MAG: High potential iron-sulfur protein [Gammaproteobacteria bacterium]
MERKLSRRSLLRGAATAAALIPVVHLGVRPALADNRVSEDEPMSKALKYVHDIDAHPDIPRPDKAGVAGEDQYCHNCALYIGDDDWGPCTIFQNRLVAAEGWCTAWVPRS